VRTGPIVVEGRQTLLRAKIVSHGPDGAALDAPFPAYTSLVGCLTLKLAAAVHANPAEGDGVASSDHPALDTYPS
jgi:hypothetical protein